jgi:hypothetical protein
MYGEGHEHGNPLDQLALLPLGTPF